jgi:hypothetical protein
MGRGPRKRVYQRSLPASRRDALYSPGIIKKNPSTRVRYEWEKMGSAAVAARGTAADRAERSMMGL